MSTFINEKTQKTLSVSTNENGNQRKNVLMSTNENAISQKTFFVSTKLDKYSLNFKYDTIIVLQNMKCLEAVNDRASFFEIIAG